MKYLFVVFYLFSLIYPAEAVTTKMFKVLDTCARYRLGEINANEAIEKLKLKLKLTNSYTNQPKDLVKKYCSVFTPNEKIEF
ncbi:MAG: non-structural protein (NS2)-like protein [Prochlorococcus marinus XMU1425]|nr:non-structural protein (NS2)-like protein [Prochlorococcus marinus XMU1425]MCR8533153.1 non-structural protein (NS2)-like protein [Prochlorococcus marinus XMU1426]